MCPVPLCENCLKWNQKLPNSGKQKCAWTSVNLLKNRGESPQRCHKLTVLEKSSLWDMLSCGCHLQPGWLAICAPGKWDESGRSVCWQWAAVTTHVSSARCQLVQGTLSLRVHTRCWLTIIINTSDFWFKLLGFFAAQLRGPTTARSESPWKWSERGNSKVSAEVTGLPSLQQQEEPYEASKLINLRFPTAENPFLKLKKKKRQI